MDGSVCWSAGVGARSGQNGSHSHVIGKGDLAILIADDGKGQGTSRDLRNVVDPAIMRLDGVGRESNQLDMALSEFGFVLGQRSQLGGADRGVILGVGEENHPIVARPLVKVDRADSGFRLKVGGNGPQTETSRSCRGKLRNSGIRSRGSQKANQCTTLGQDTKRVVLERIRRGMNQQEKTNSRIEVSQDLRGGPRLS